jgi:hypothetical protein
MAAAARPVPDCEYALHGITCGGGGHPAAVAGGSYERHSMFTPEFGKVGHFFVCRSFIFFSTL